MDVPNKGEKNKNEKLHINSFKNGISFIFPLNGLYDFNSKGNIDNFNLTCPR